MTSTELLTPLQSYLRKDFYASFMHAQGNSNLQHNLFGAMALFYQTSLDVPPISDVSWLGFEKLPLSHLGQSYAHEELSSECENMAKDFQTVINKTLANPDQVESFRRTINKGFYANLIHTDFRYQDPDDKRGIGTDPHKSYFRTFVLLKQKTGRESIDHAYADLRGSLRDLVTPDTMIDLRIGWEANHSGSLFDPLGMVPSNNA